MPTPSKASDLKSSSYLVFIFRLGWQVVMEKKGISQKKKVPCASKALQAFHLFLYSTFCCLLCSLLCFLPAVTPFLQQAAAFSWICLLLLDPSFTLSPSTA
mmetsp:Transcript_46534/g.83207  ORF Transcript_46534/g.83207 Transcript_46534/m.83207 type:complete len:101 (-) Transcript_46534:675-977(-)